MEPVDFCFRSVQGGTTIVVEQDSYFQRLENSIQSLVEITGQFDEKII